jgi:hypothetical protein
MSIPHPPENVLLLMGILRNPAVSLETVRERVTDSFGPIQAWTDEIPFTFTSYYTPEMGSDIRRSYCTFTQTVSPGDLADIKLATYRLETEFLHEQQRLVNLDPGLLTMHSLILASCKDFSHRIYLCDGIFAEVTLVYSKGRFTALPWTYPDYQHPDIIAFFDQQRTQFLEQRRNNS